MLTTERWALVCTVEDVPVGEGRTTDVSGRRVAVFRTRTGWFAVDAACPHLGGPLADGIVAGGAVTCPLHERRFDLRTGKPVGHEGCAVAAHVVEVRDGDVFVALRA